MKTNARLFMLISLLIFHTSLSAATNDPISMVVGPSTGSYRVFGLDIAKQALKEGVTIEIKESTGDIENIKRLASHENATFAIVDEAILNFLQNDAQLKKIGNKLRVIYPFYHAEIHVLAKTSLSNMGDLNGKKIVVGLQGGGTSFTAQNLFKTLQINPTKVYLPFSDGVEKLLKGEVDAVMYVAGKPVPLFNNLSSLANSHPEVLKSIHFLPIKADEKLINAGYYNAEITHNDYAIIEKTVPTIATKNMLISYNFSEENNAYAKNRCAQIRLVTKAISENITELKDTGHQKWKEVELDADIGKWQRSGCVYIAPKNNELNAVKNCLVKGLCN